jgi:UDP-N-acetylmuramoylalanine--D-glutamate ligase
VALASFDRPVHVILGGRGKGQDFAPLRPALAGAAGVYLIGEAAPALRDVLGSSARDCGDLERALAAARAAAAPGDVVLLSPACASFDQYEDFEARGRHFKSLVGRPAAARR